MSNSPPPTTPTNQQGQQNSQTNPGNSAGTNHQASGSRNTQIQTPRVQISLQHQVVHKEDEASHKLLHSPHA